MGMLGLKPVLAILIFGLVFYFAWGLGNGYVTWKKPETACFGGNHWTKLVGKQPFLSIGKLTLKYQPWAWSCDPDRIYDPAIYEVVNGVLVPRPDATN